jgi:hypothetical protein
MNKTEFTLPNGSSQAEGARETTLQSQISCAKCCGENKQGAVTRRECAGSRHSRVIMEPDSLGSNPGSISSTCVVQARDLTYLCLVLPSVKQTKKWMVPTSQGSWMDEMSLPITHWWQGPGLDGGHLFKGPC